MMPPMCKRMGRQMEEMAMGAMVGTLVPQGPLHLINSSEERRQRECRQEVKGKERRSSRQVLGWPELERRKEQSSSSQPARQSVWILVQLMSPFHSRRQSNFC